MCWHLEIRVEIVWQELIHCLFPKVVSYNMEPEIKKKQKHFHKMQDLRVAAFKVKKWKESIQKMAANAERAPALQQGQAL